MTNAKTPASGCEPRRATKQVGQTGTQRTASGRTYAMPPCRGRRLWLALHGDVMKVCPVTGEAYRLAPVRRQREAVRRG